MYEFLDRLISLALPRVRDFRGLNPNAFDGHGNYSLGLSEQLVFPELNPDKFTRPQGMNVTLVISSGRQRRSRASCCAASACRSRPKNAPGRQDGSRLKASRDLNARNDHVREACMNETNYLANTR